MRSIALYRPGKEFPAVSVTGGRCELMCEHCQGRFLKGMAAAMDPASLGSIADAVQARGGTGLLISGGCDRQGRVPLGPFLSEVARIKSTTGLLINLHPGLVSDREAEAIALSGADRVSFDLVLDPGTINDLMHLKRDPEDYLASFSALCRSAPGRVVPHILLGAGREERELEAVRAACRADVPCVILLSLLGGEAGDWGGRLLRAVGEGIRGGRPVILGCMRPRGEPATEVAALEAGAEGIAYPSASTVQEIVERGWAVQERKVCCALHR